MENDFSIIVSEGRHYRNAGEFHRIKGKEKIWRL